MLRTPLAAAWLALLLAGPSWAGRPLATEDADVLDRGECEWESFAARESASGEPSSRTLSTQFGCGVGAMTQASLAYARDRSEGQSSPSWALVGKTALLPREGEGLGLTLAWGLGWQRTPGAGWKHEEAALNLVATRSFADRFTAHANLGWVRTRSDDLNTTTWNAALEWAAREGLDLMGEVYGDDRTRPWLGLGVRYAITERVSVDASWSVQNDTPRAKLWTVGFKLGF
jgi:hypothetical protein